MSTHRRLFERRRSPLTIALAAIWWAGCASGGAEPAPRPDGAADLVVEIENNLAPAVAVTVLVDDPTEIERLLGSVDTGLTRSFPLDTSNLTAGYRLVAETADGETIRSDPVDALGASTVHWDLEQNILRVRPAGDGPSSSTLAFVCRCVGAASFPVTLPS